MQSCTTLFVPCVIRKIQKLSDLFDTGKILIKIVHFTLLQIPIQEYTFVVKKQTISKLSFFPHFSRFVQTSVDEAIMKETCAFLNTSYQHFKRSPTLLHSWQPLHKIRLTRSSVISNVNY